MNRSTLKRWCGCGALLLAMAAAQLYPVPPSRAGAALVLGTVDEDAREELAEFEPVAEYLRRRLRAAGVDDVRISAHTTIGGIADAVAAGAMDVYIDSPLLAALVGRETGAKPFLRAWKEGVAEYHTLFYARADSGVRSLDDLRGRVLAFKSAESTPGHLVPRADLLRRGYRLIELERPEDPVPPDAIGYVFAYGDRTALAWVMKGVVAAAAVKSGFLAEDSLRKLRRRLTVVDRTPAVPRQVLMRRAGLAPEIVAALESALLDMHRTGEGRRALEAMHGTAKFDRFPGGAEAAFMHVHAMIELLERERRAGGGGGALVN